MFCDKVSLDRNGHWHRLTYATVQVLNDIKWINVNIIILFIGSLFL